MNIDKYVSSFKNLNTDKSRTRWSAETQFRAPHKPLLLLSIIDLFAQGHITTNLIELDSELSELFNLYWSIVMPPDKHGNIALPFYHLKSDGFWHLQATPNNETAITVPIRSITKLQELVLGARLDEELYSALHAESKRNILRTVLIDTYFSDVLQIMLVKQGDVNLAAYEYSRELLERPRNDDQLATEDIEEPVRDQGFKRAIVKTYEHRCAFCGVRILSPQNHTAIEAAHIIPWSESHNDDPRNGLALCKLCHWTFDAGLTTVTNKYKVKLSKFLFTNDNVAGHIGTFNERLIYLPKDEIYYPKVEYLTWHRRNKFHNY
jgi:putative restriction endonuclease